MHVSFQTRVLVFFFLSIKPGVELLGHMVVPFLSFSVSTAALFTVAELWEEPKCPSTYKWIKMWCVYIYIYSGILLSHKKNGILPFAAT